MALFALSLAQGSTILAISIKAGTIKGYLRAAAGLSKHAQLADPTRNFEGKLADPIQRVLHEQKRWEEMPNRRELVEPIMIDDMWELCKLLSIDSLEYALYDWNVLGQVFGFRLSEWAQNEEDKKNYPKKAVDGTSLAFIIDDFIFLGKNWIYIIQGFEVTLRPDDIENIEIRWRYQKNNDNGQRISVARNRRDPKKCPVLAAIRIYLRAQRLNTAANQPLAVFKKKNKTTFITNRMISKHLQGSARRVYNITDKKKLSLWTPHSIRVGTCVLLSTIGKDGPFIQLRLRWRSLAFMDYLRNTRTLAKEHATALARAADQFKNS